MCHSVTKGVLTLDECLVLASLIWPTSVSCWTDTHPATCEPWCGPWRNAISGILHIQYTFPATPLFSQRRIILGGTIKKKPLHNDAPPQVKWPVARAAGCVANTENTCSAPAVWSMQTKYYVKDLEFKPQECHRGRAIFASSALIMFLRAEDN